MASGVMKVIVDVSVLRTVNTAEIHKKVWGQETWIVNNDEYCGKLLDIDLGAMCSVHYHLAKHETFYCLSGRVLLMLWPGYDPAEGVHLTQYQYQTLLAGDSIEIPRGLPHSFKGMRRSRMIEFSTHHDDNDSIRLTQSTKGGA